MHLLIQKLPKTAIIDGLEYDIEYSFVNMLLFEEILADTELSDSFKLQNALNNFYKGNIPDNITKAEYELYWFYLMGDIQTTDNNTKVPQKPVYSFKHDAKYIYSAFKTQYNIDLYDNKELHWWKFMSLFSSLTEEHLFSKIMHYRSVDLKEIKDKSRKQFYKEMKELYALPEEVIKVNQKSRGVLTDNQIGNAFL